MCEGSCGYEKEDEEWQIREVNSIIFCLMKRGPARSTPLHSLAASGVYKGQHGFRYQ